MLRRDPRGTMRFASLQGETARAIVARHPALASEDSLVLVEGQGSEERVHVGPDAVQRVAAYLGGPWRAARTLHLVPRPLRNAAYRLFARVRHRAFGRYAACPTPDPAVRERFLP